MDMNQLNNLDDANKERYLRFAALFSAPGWKDLQEFYKEKVDLMTKAGANATTWEDSRIALGMRLAYEEFLNLEESNELEFTEIADSKINVTSADDEEFYE